MAVYEILPFRVEVKHLDLEEWYCRLIDVDTNASQPVAFKHRELPLEAFLDFVEENKDLSLEDLVAELGC